MTAIAALGDVDIDMVLTVDSYPPPGGESFARDAAIRLGGSAVNTAVTLARLGFQPSLLAQVGDDDFGHRARSMLAGTGVDMSHVVTSRTEATGMNLVLVTRDGERTMIGLRGANRTYDGFRGCLPGFGWLHLSGYALIEEPQRNAALSALEAARREEIPVSIDIPSGVAHHLGARLTPILADVAMVSVGREALDHLLPGPDPLGSLHRSDVGLVAVTDGSQPFVIHRSDESVTLTPPSVGVVDTTGAGDSFMAGLIAGALWGLELGPTAIVAAVLGAAATGERGAGHRSWDPAGLGAILEQWTDVDRDWLDNARDRLL